MFNLIIHRWRWLSKSVFELPQISQPRLSWIETSNKSGRSFTFVTLSRVVLQKLQCVVNLTEKSFLMSAAFIAWLCCLIWTLTEIYVLSAEDIMAGKCIHQMENSEINDWFVNENSIRIQHLITFLPPTGSIQFAIEEQEEEVSWHYSNILLQNRFDHSKDFQPWIYFYLIAELNPCA